MKLILVADKNWAIGKDGGLLVHLPGDLKYFKEKTKGKTVVMGRTTLESLPGKKPLPQRENFVLTRQKDYFVEGAKVVHSAEELNAQLGSVPRDEVMIIGGADVYNQFFEQCDTCYITKIYEEFQADRHFINLDERDDMEIVWSSQIQEENGIKYQFFEYKRIN